MRRWNELKPGSMRGVHIAAKCCRRRDLMPFPGLDTVYTVRIYMSEVCLMWTKSRVFAILDT